MYHWPKLSTATCQSYQPILDPSKSVPAHETMLLGAAEVTLG